MREIASLVEVSLQSASSGKKGGATYSPCGRNGANCEGPKHRPHMADHGEGSYETKSLQRLKEYSLETLMEAISLKGFDVSATAWASSPPEIRDPLPRASIGADPGDDVS